MKSILILGVCVINLFSYFAFSAPVERPKIKPDEKVIFHTEKYHVFKFIKYEKLELSANCFNLSKSVRNKILVKPKCQAYDIANIKFRDLVNIKGSGTNPASLHCKRMLGESLIAYDHLNNEYDYCRFPDGSYVSSWSMFDKSYQKAKK